MPLIDDKLKEKLVAEERKLRFGEFVKEQTTLQTCVNSPYNRIHSKQLLVSSFRYLKNLGIYIRFPTRILTLMCNNCTSKFKTSLYLLSCISSAAIYGTSLACSNETAAKIDRAVVELVKEAHEKARRILLENKDKLDEISAFLLEKETITGEEFMEILHRED